jgi:hypothetical protein
MFGEALGVPAVLAAMLALATLLCTGACARGARVRVRLVCEAPELRRGGPRPLPTAAPHSTRCQRHAPLLTRRTPYHAATSRFAGVLTWRDCLEYSPAWDTLIWFTILISMSNGLNESGLINAFAGVVGQQLTALNLGWEVSGEARGVTGARGSGAVLLAGVRCLR